MFDFSTQSGTTQQPSYAATYDEGLRSYMLSIYNHMGAALALTGMIALFASESSAFLQALYTIENNRVTGMKPLAWLVMLAPLGVALWMGVALQRMSLNAVKAGFWGFAVLMGLSLTTVFLTYTGTSIARVFFITAATFCSMSIYGYATQRDLTKMGSFLMMGVIGVILASLVNMFLQSSALQFALSVLGVVIFTGLTAYDTQKIKHMYYSLSYQGEQVSKAVMMGAFTLYLDFINIFMSLLHLLGERRQ